MPIRPSEKSRYPKDWPAISKRIRERADNLCEHCGIPNGSRRENAAGKMVNIVLTVAHLDHQPENCADKNLAALCQKCHNSYDAPMRARGIKQRRRAQWSIGDFFNGN
jgi:5-methylcytosine-specific restriction endonuclease McrA